MKAAAEVRAGWTRKPLKRTATINPEVLAESTDPDVRLAYVDIGGVTFERGITKMEEMRFADAPSRARRKVRHGDTIVSTVRTYLQAIAPIIEPPDNLIVSTGFAVIRAYRGIDPPFLSWALRSSDFVEAVVANSVGVSYPAIAPSEIARLPIAIPPLPAQRAIADFLDRETAKIDILIAKHEKLAKLIEEKRHAIITRLVTSGADNSIARRQSGIEWIGQCPSHWPIMRIKYVAKLESGHTPSKTVAEYWENCDIPWVSLNDTAELARCDYISDTAYKINQLGLENSSARLLPARAVVFTRDATVGLTAITTRPMAVSQHLIAWICGPSILPEYLLRAIYAMRGELERLTSGATIKTIGMPLIAKLVTPVPPIREQEGIVQEIEKSCEQADRALRIVWSMIERLRERRRSLITAAVAGRLEIAPCPALEAAE